MTLITAIINLLLVLLLSPLLEGVMRKLKAVIHSRKGPPIIQPYLDLFKLLGKEDLQATSSPIFRLAPILCLGAVLVVALLTPMGADPPLSFSGDVIAWIYFLMLATVAVILGAFASGNPYAYIGGAREMMMALTMEPVVLVALIAAALKSGSLGMGDMILWQTQHGPAISMVVAAVAFFLALQANLGKLPFDIPEAETEIMEGPFIEQSGPRLALFKWSFYAKQMIFASVMVQVFLPWPRFGVLGADLVLHLVKVFFLILVVGVIDSVNPRLRIDQSMNYFGRVLLVSFAALAFAAVGV